VAHDQGVHVARIPVFVVAGDDAIAGHERERGAVLGSAGAVARPADAGAVRPLGQAGELLAAVPGEQALQRQYAALGQPAQLIDDLGKMTLGHGQVGLRALQRLGEGDAGEYGIVLFVVGQTARHQRARSLADLATHLAMRAGGAYVRKLGHASLSYGDDPRPAQVARPAETAAVAPARTARGR
jgi:hypothetical protein